MILYFRASFQLFSHTLKSFRGGDFIRTRKGITEYSPKLDKVFVNADQIANPLSKKLLDLTFAVDSSHEKNNLFGTFYFRNQSIWARQ